MKDSDCVHFLQWALPKLHMRWPGFRKVRRQVCKRVDRRLRELGLADANAYRTYLEQHPEEWTVLDDLCRISISRFYRDRAVFDLIRDEVLPRLASAAVARGESAVRSWNAGCASGEEAYTLKIIWELAVRPHVPEVDLQIVTTDADPRLLDRARRASYPPSSLKDFPEEWIPTAFTHSGEEFRLRDDFRNGIQFLQQDIRHEQPAGPFDIIFCRHLVFTYFDEPLQLDLLRKILAQLHPDGALVTGKQEPLPPGIDYLEEVAPHSGVYRLTAGERLLG